MKKARFFLTSFLILICSEFAFSQSNEIKEVINKNGYDYIPISYLTDTTIGGIRCLPQWTKIKKNTFQFLAHKRFEFYWHSACTDGTYSLIITPEQIYLIDRHENPNPNHLYWVLPIDSLTYQQIISGFQKIGIEYSYFDRSYNEENLLLTDEDGYNLFYYCDTLIEIRIDNLFAGLNKFMITDETRKLDKTKRIIPKSPIYYSSDKKELELWIDNKR